MPNNSAPRAHDDAQTRVLRFLWRSRSEWSGREVARRVGLSAPSCHEALRRLEARGLVLLRRVSNMHLYALNPESYLVTQAFAPFFSAEEAMPARVAELLARTLGVPSKGGVLSVVVFGSTARQTAREDSDLDVCVVLRGKEDAEALEPRVERLRAALFTRFNLSLSPYVQTLAELRRKHARGLPLIGEVLKEGRVVYGSGLKELLA